MDKLLPCPFCGECASLKMVVVNGSRRYGVVCEGGGCPLNNPLTYISTAKWNRRAPQAQEEPSGDPAPGVSEGAKRAVSEVARSLEAICKVADPIIAKYQPPAPASPGGLVWTKQKPTQPGWYWLRHKGWEDPGDFSIECFWLEGRELLNEYNQRPEDAGYEWAGPIPEPAAPEAGAPGTQEGGSHG